MRRFSHAFDIAFEVTSGQREGADVTPEMLAEAIRQRVTDCLNNGSLAEAVGPPFDTYFAPQYYPETRPRYE